MKKKYPLILVASSVIMLAASTIGSTKATLTYMSDNYLAQIDIKSIGVTLTENGKDVSWRDYQHKDDAWSEATGTLLGSMLKDAGDEKLILDKKYNEELAVKNSGSIDEYVRVTVQHYWVDKETGENAVIWIRQRLRLILQTMAGLRTQVLKLQKEMSFIIQIF